MSWENDLARMYNPILARDDEPEPEFDAELDAWVAAYLPHVRARYRINYYGCRAFQEALSVSDDEAIATTLGVKWRWMSK